jgi:hypothetical protein
MPELSGISWAVIIACAVMIGFSKTGIPGAGILVAQQKTRSKKYPDILVLAAVILCVKNWL